MWPEEFAERYRSYGYWSGSLLGTLSRNWALAFGERTAICEDGLRVSYAEFDRLVDQAAGRLHGIGLRSGDRSVIQLPNTLDFLTVSFAMFKLGVIPVFALPAHRYQEVSHIARLSEASSYVIPDDRYGFDFRTLAAQVAQSEPSLRHVLVSGDPGEFTSLQALPFVVHRDVPGASPSDVALFLLSGGSTGVPKLVPRTHDDYAYNFRACAQRLDLSERSVYLAALPIAHNFALACPGVLGVLSVGGCVVLTTSPSADEAFEIIAREHVTETALVPPLAVMWTEAAEFTEHDLSSLRIIQVGGARFDPHHVRRMRTALGTQVQQSFGMAEGILIQTSPKDSDETVDTCQGRPISPGDEIRIVDEDDYVLPNGAVGYLQARGPYTIRAYYGVPEFNRRAFTEDGFLRTGDRAVISSNETVTVLGRSDDVLNRGGEKISVEEVETQLLQHPEILDAAVVGSPDRLFGERICAFLVARGRTLSLREVSAYFARRGIAAFKTPDLVEYVAELPKTSVGKVDKAALRRKLVARPDLP